jgi:iron complex outermembrane recepter protein
MRVDVGNVRNLYLTLAVSFSANLPFCIAAEPPQIPADSEPALEQIVVTAEKRNADINAVGMAITALTAGSLESQGVTSVADLVKVVPGFTATPSSAGTPVYTLRGVGFYEYSLATYPDVTVYVDEVPLPFPTMTTFADLDLQQVEVLKGPQGILYGQNSTGGAINYIAAKPSSTLNVGANASYGRFNTAELSAYIGGPLTEELTGRISAKVTDGGAWQESETRPGETTGGPQTYIARALLDWNPVERLHVEANVNGWLDRSHTQAGQYVGLSPQTPAGIFPELANYPFLTSQNSRLADWSPNEWRRADDSFGQVAAHADYSLSSGLTFTSVTSYGHLRRNQGIDNDGVALNNLYQLTTGTINTLFQEARVTSPNDGRFRWITGANIENDNVSELDSYEFNDTTSGRFNRVLSPHFGNLDLSSDQHMKTAAAFASVDYDVLTALTFKAGARYTRADRSFAGCTRDSGDGTSAPVFNFTSDLDRGIAGLPPLTGAQLIQPGGCITLNSQLLPGLIHKSLNQSNVSWRGGLDYRFQNDGLIYVNVVKGYKAGSFTTASATTQDQFAPVTQESVLDYEAGFKALLQGGRLSVNGALFYYDYRDKQLHSKIIDPFFGPVDALQNIPKSYVEGVESAVDWQATSMLRMGVSATYLKTRVTEFVGVNVSGVEANFAGAEFPYTPKLQVVANAEFIYPLSNGYLLSLGANALYHSMSWAAIGNEPIPNATGSDLDFAIKSYTTLDLRLGIETPDSKWRAALWGRNVTNEYYWTNVSRASDTIFRLAGMPATYGGSLSYRF